MHPIFVLLFMVLIIIIAILIHRVIKQGGAFNEDGEYVGDDYEVTSDMEKITLPNLKDKLRKMANDEVKENKDIYAKYDWFTDFISVDHNDLTNAINDLKVAANPRYHYLLTVMQAWQYVGNEIETNDIFRKWDEIMYEINIGLEAQASDNNCTDYFADVIINKVELEKLTQELYDKLNHSLDGITDDVLDNDALAWLGEALYHMQELITIINDVKWTKILNNCILAKSRGLKTKPALRKVYDDDESEYRAPVSN